MKRTYILVNLFLIFLSSTILVFAKDENIIELENFYNELDEDVFLEYKPIKNVKISVTGDLMVHDKQLIDALAKGKDHFDFTNAFKNIKEYLIDADYTIGNLETCLGGEELKYTGYPMFNTPDSFAFALKDAGYDLLTTANNHSNDRYEKGILRTLKVLDYFKIDHIGTYSSKEERDKIFIKDINGIKFAFLSYTYATNGIPLSKNKPYLCNLLDLDLIKKDIENAKTFNPDFIIVFPHMGNEYEVITSEEFKVICKTILEAGADIILASHPHVLQPVEFVEIIERDNTIRECFVVYSLGNFISSQRKTPRDIGSIFNLYFEKNDNNKAYLTKVSYVPTWVKYKDLKGDYDISVLPIYEAINRKFELDENDFVRLKNAHFFTSEKFLKIKLPIEKIKPNYFIKDLLF